MATHFVFWHGFRFIEMVLEIKRGMVNHFKRIQHVFLVLDAITCRIKNPFWNKNHPTPSNMIFFLFYQMLEVVYILKERGQNYYYNFFKLCVRKNKKSEERAKEVESEQKKWRKNKRSGERTKRVERICA